MTKWKDLRPGDWVRLANLELDGDLTVTTVDTSTGLVTAEKAGRSHTGPATDFWLLSAVEYPGRRLPKAFSARVGKRLPRSFRGTP